MAACVHSDSSVSQVALRWAATKAVARRDVGVVLKAVRSALEAIYVRRLTRKLEGRPRPRHVAIMLDGNRRWARGAGHDDVREGYRVGGAKVTDFLQWCAAADIQHVTLWMLSDDNLHRPADELGPLLEIIEETVQRVCATEEAWEVSVIGALDLLPGDTARVLKEAASRTTGRGGLTVDVAVGYGGAARSSTPCGPPSTGTSARAAIRATWPPTSTSSTSPTTCTRPPATTPTSSSARPANSGCPASCCGSPPTPRSTSSTCCGRRSGR